MSCASFSPTPTLPCLITQPMTGGVAVRSQESYAPTVSSSTQYSTPSPVTYPSLSASLARDASPPTPSSGAALHVRFSQVHSGPASLYNVPYNRDTESPYNVPTNNYANYDVPHSPAISCNRRLQGSQSCAQKDSSTPDQSRTGFQHNSFALYDQLPRSTNGSPNPILRVSTTSPSTNPSSLATTPLPPPLPYRSELTSLQSSTRAPSPEYVAMACAEDSTPAVSNSWRRSRSSNDFATPVPFLSAASNGKETPAHTFK